MKKLNASDIPLERGDELVYVVESEIVIDPFNPSNQDDVEELLEAMKGVGSGDIVRVYVRKAKK